MKKLLLSLFGVLIALPSMAQSFAYTYQNQTVNYAVYNEEAKIAMTLPSKISGHLTLPTIVKNGETEYSLRYIGYGSFTGRDLKSVIIPTSVTDRITSDTFNFNYLKKVAYPKDIVFDYEPPRKTDNETCLIPYDRETAEVSDNGCLYTEDGKKLTFVPCDITDLTIPEGVTSIGENAFSSCDLATLTIPSTIEVVEANAFIDCNIQRVNITDFSKWYANVKLGNLYSNPYRECDVYAGGIKVDSPELKEGLEEISDYINAGLNINGELELPSTLKRIGAYAFYNATELSKIYMPEGLEEIGESAFEGCSLLENPELPSSLKKIEDNAFKGCRSLTKIILPEGLNYLGKEIFANCGALEKAALVSDIDVLKEGLFYKCGSLNTVYLPLNLKRIEKLSFYDCVSLDEITFPSTLEAIGDSAFMVSGSMSIESMIYIDRGALSKLKLPNNVKEIGKHSFNSQGITHLEIGSGLEIIPEGAFSSCPLQIVSFSEGLKEIHEYAFANCNMGKCSLPSTVNKICAGAFSYTWINELTIPDNVTELLPWSCGIPTMLTIGSGVKTIASDAFSFYQLHVLRIKTLNPPTLSDVLPIKPEQNDALTLIVNDGRRQNFITNARWKQIDNIIEESSSDITIYMTGEYALSEEIRTTTGLMPSCVTKMKIVGPLTDTDMRIIGENMISLQSLDMSEVTNVTEIPYSMFYGSLLSEIKLPKGLTAIGEAAFSECPLLQISELPDGITEIGKRAFAGSPRVTVNALPKSLKTIGDEAFKNCMSLQSISAGESLERLGSSAFYGCSLLESVDFSTSSLRSTAKESSIAKESFRDCRQLDEILLPESISSIGEYAFAGTAIRDIAFAANASEIGEGAFSDCRRLVTANIPEKVKSVSEGLFSNSGRMIAVTMPAATTNVAPNIVMNDKKIANISCAAIDAPAAQNGAFDGLRMRYVSLTVPTTSFRSYLNAPQWGKFQSIQNRIPVSIDPGVDVSNIAEDEYQEMLTEDALEEAIEAAAQETETENPAQVQRRVARRAAARATTYEGRQFAALFNGAQILSGNEGSATRIFVNPKEGVNVTSILFNGEEMLGKMDGNSLLLPNGSNGSLVIKTDGKANEDSINTIDADTDTDVKVYNLSGMKVADSLNGLPKGIYIVRTGSKATKIVI